MEFISDDGSGFLHGVSLVSLSAAPLQTLPMLALRNETAFCLSSIHPHSLRTPFVLWSFPSSPQAISSSRPLIHECNTRHTSRKCLLPLLCIQAYLALAPGPPGGRNLSQYISEPLYLAHSYLSLDFCPISERIKKSMSLPGAQKNIILGVVHRLR